MRLTSPFLQSYRFVGRPPVQLERVLAVGRAFLIVSALVHAIYLDPTEPARLRAITYAVLAAYALYSLAVRAYVHRAARLTPGHGYVLHGMDIARTSALTFVSEGPVSPFFLFFLFVVVAAAYRGGFREAAGTVVIIAAVFLVETAIRSGGASTRDLALLGPGGIKAVTHFRQGKTIRSAFSGTRWAGAVRGRRRIHSLSFLRSSCCTERRHSRGRVG